MSSPQFARFRPHPALIPYIECYWMLQSHQQAPVETQVLPADGRVELMFSFAAGSHRSAADGSDECEVRSYSFVLGARSQGYRVEHFGSPSYVAVRFKTGGLSAFSRLPLAELTDIYVDLDCIWDAQTVRKAEEQLATAPSPEHQAAILDRLLLARLSPPDHLERLLYTVFMIETQQAVLTMPELAGNINLSQKHFERLFARYIGFRPSLFARVARFQQAMYSTQSHLNRFTLGQVAAHLGYYDQAHFTKDFKRFSGLNPNLFFATSHEFIQIATPSQVVEFLQDTA